MKFSWDVFFIKITSRKFWVALTGLVTSIMAFFNCNNETIVQVAAVISSLGTVIGYLIANGLKEDTSSDVNDNSETAKTENKVD